MPRSAILVGITGVVCASGAMAGVEFAEFDPYTGDVLAATGTIAGSPFSMAITNMTGGDVRFRSPLLITNNASSTFDDPAFTPPTAGIDQLHVAQLGSASNDSSIAFAFTDPVTDPVFHFSGLDATAWDFGVTPGLTKVSLLSGNGQLTVAGMTIVRDVTGDVASGSASGSVRLFGTFTSIDVDIVRLAPGTGDGHVIQLSVPAPGVAVPLILVGVTCRRRRRV